MRDGWRHLTPGPAVWITFGVCLFVSVALSLIYLFSSVRQGDPSQRTALLMLTVGFMLGTILLALALVLLFFQLLKATRGGGASITENALSTMVFATCMILFLVWDRAATSTFFLLTLMSMVDVIAAFAVTLNAARREYGTRGQT